MSEPTDIAKVLERLAKIERYLYLRAAFESSGVYYPDMARELSNLRESFGSQGPATAQDTTASPSQQDNQG